MLKNVCKMMDCQMSFFKYQNVCQVSLRFTIGQKVRYERQVGAPMVVNLTYDLQTLIKLDILKFCHLLTCQQSGFYPPIKFYQDRTKGTELLYVPDGQTHRLTLRIYYIDILIKAGILRSFFRSDTSSKPKKPNVQYVTHMDPLTYLTKFEDMQPPGPPVMGAR